MSEYKPNRFIPTADIVTKAAENLPPAESWRSDTFHVPLKDERLLEFRKIKFKTKTGRVYKWVYEGKLLVR